MISFPQIVKVKISEGEAVAVRVRGQTLWRRLLGGYVSLGDSIAAGHSINGDWAEDYGYASQYGENGNASTVIVPGSYTDLIRADLMAKHGGKDVFARSFAHSGDTVVDLIEKLSHESVRTAIGKATIVTVCIGANDVLQPAMRNLESYINNGTPALAEIAREVQQNLDILADNTHACSYKALFDKLCEINPTAKYVFLNVYNPFKYLWLDESTADNDYKDGFFGPLMWAVPDTIGNLSNAVRGALHDTDAVQMVFDRINGVRRDGSDGLSAWTETHVSLLNQVLAQKIAEYGKANFVVADAKALFETVPDRPVTAAYHYNDLVNVEFTRGYVVEDMDWSQFWANISLSDIISSPEEIMGNIIENVVSNVIVPDIDPHPEVYGQYILKRAAAAALEWEELDSHTITFNANGGSGSMAIQTVPGVDGLPAFCSLNANTFAGTGGNHFAGWNTKADGTGTAYQNGQIIGVSGDLTLYAMWSSEYTITVRHSYSSALHGDSDTGPMECYALWIDGTEQSDLGAFSNGARVYKLQGTSKVGVIVQTESGADRSYITLNGTKIAGNSDDARYTFDVTANMDIHFEWNYWFDGLTPQSYWNCYVTTY